MTVCIYLAHLNPVTNAHVEIIKELKNQASVIVMPVIFQRNDREVNSRSFPFNFEIRKKMLDVVFGDSFTVSKNYTFYSPFFKYLPPLLSPFSWKIREQVLSGINEDYFTYTGDTAEGYMLKAYGLKPKIGKRRTISAASVKNKLYDAAKGDDNTWKADVPAQVVEVILDNWNVVKKFASLDDRTIRVAGMKFPKDGYWTK